MGDQRREFSSCGSAQRHKSLYLRSKDVHNCTSHHGDAGRAENEGRVNKQSLHEKFIS
jgi:hypothetical protein